MVSQKEKERYMSMIGQGGKRILHMEWWSNPDAETYLTGIDHYERPRDCRLRLAELYPMLELPIPATNEPIPRPTLGGSGKSSNPDNHTVRWGDSESSTFEHGEKYFKTVEDVFNFHPLQHADFSEWKFVVENRDYSDEQKLYESYRRGYPAEWEKAPEFSMSSCGFYNTTIMWPMLTFGWEMFLASCLDEEFEPVMEEFAEINRRVFRSFAKLPVNFCSCHDDIAMTNGAICSPEWMNKYVFPRYEEYFGMLRAAGIRPYSVADGKADVYVDDLIRCGSTGLISEPYCDYKAMAKKYPDMMMAGEGDNRILTYGTKDDIRKMVERMVETGKMCGGYFMCIGNHIPWNVPGESLKYYFDYSDKLAWR